MKDEAEEFEALTRRMAENWETAVCKRCSSAFGRRKDGPLEDICPDCAARISREATVRQEAEAIVSGLDTNLDRWLRDAGLSTRELSARMSQVPDTLLTLLITPGTPVQASVQAMLDGRIPQQGFGLFGQNGTGKTFALAGVLRMMLSRRWELTVPEHGAAALRERWLAWCAWPETVNRFRVESVRDGGLEEVQRAVNNLAAAPLLILDDLGVERLRGTYEEDWVASQLDILVDQRYNEQRPTCYTTNLSPAEFARRYGSRLFSRLCGENFPLLVPRRHDMRTEHLRTKQ